MDATPGLQLPLSSLHLLVPPVRLMSACMWQVARQRNVNQYGKLAEFITLVTEMVPELLSPKQRTQLILGLRARLILELLQKVGSFDCEAIQDHLNSFQLWTADYMHEEVQDGEVEMSKSAFVALVQTLINDVSEKQQFFKEVFPAQYGARFDTALQILVWELFSRLEDFLPVPSFSQVASSFDLAPLDSQLEQFVSESEDLRMLLQHQKRQQKLPKSEFSFMSDTILSALAFKQTAVAEIEVEIEDRMDGRFVESKQKTQQQENSRTREDAREEKPGVVGGNDHANSVLPQITRRLPLRAHKRPAKLQQQIGEEHSKDNSGVREAKLIGVLHQNRRPPTKESKKHTCLQCGRVFRRPSELKRHHNSAHSQKDLFSCDQCKKSFKTKRRLEQHAQAHTGVKPYICSYCGKGLSCPNVLKTHLRLHTGERPYACTVCDKRFNQRYTLTLHLRLHKGEKTCLCSECGKGFYSSGALLVHSRVHTGDRPYHCTVCGKTYTTLQRLKVHQQYHTGERPFPCSYCEKRFHTTNALKDHVRCHTGEKPFKCLECDKRFSQAYNLKVHMRSHKVKLTAAE